MSRINNFNQTIAQKTCEECGKEIVFFGKVTQYLYRRTYKDKIIYFCSDKCKRTFEEKHIRDRRRLGGRNHE